MNPFYVRSFCSVILLLTFFSSANAQYYYKDIWTIQQSNKEFSLLKNENIRTVSIKSFEDDGEPSEGFYCERKIDRNFTKSEMISRSNITQQSLLVTIYNDKGWVLKTVDSSQTSLARSDYEYDSKGRITKVSTFTKANDEKGGISEVHQYFYGEAGRVEKMIRRKNSADVSVVNFTVDEKGNVIEEQEMVRGLKGRNSLYYYDDKNRLTDVVRYNTRAKRLLPDYMYEYNQLGQIKQMIATDDNINNYFVWKYTYNDKRLRETEKCYSKERRLLGSIQYQYK